MAVYKLCLADDGDFIGKRVEFEAQDVNGALPRLASEATGRPAELWRSEHLIGSLVRTEESYWRTNV